MFDNSLKKTNSDRFDLFKTYGVPKNKNEKEID